MHGWGWQDRIKEEQSVGETRKRKEGDRKEQVVIVSYTGTSEKRGSKESSCAGSRFHSAPNLLCDLRQVA